MNETLTAAVNLPTALSQKVSNVTVAGWVHTRRDHGGLIFIDLRDSTGLVQLVFNSETASLFQQANQLRPEWVILVDGILRERSAELVNANLLTGKLEIFVQTMRVLNAAKTPPINVNDDNVNEDKRLLYRYLDLRRPKMQDNLKLRARFHQFIRQFMEKEQFTEVSTPILANSSPEGARDFLVPSRLQPGRFYALPQAPQQFKQLLMIGGLDRYYQIAPCFRDEDPRADRLYGDFYQLDLEVAFVEDSAEVRQLITPLAQGLIEDFANLKLYQNQFFELTYQQALSRYGTDKPDLRYDLELVDVATVFQQTQVQVFAQILAQQGTIKALSVPAVFSRAQFDQLTAFVQSKDVAGLAFLSYVDNQWQGPLVKFCQEAELAQLHQLFQMENGHTIFIVAHHQQRVVETALGALRVHLAELLQLADPQVVAAVWVVDFPFFELDDQQQLTFAHNPFSAPKGDLEQADKLSLVADQFDLVFNGREICSGALRNHDPQQLMRTFELAGYEPTTIQTQFGALLNALQYGAPPHGGCAFGLDRLLMVLTNESNIRELVAFPKNGSGLDLMMSSPAQITPQQASELGLKMDKR